MYGAPLEGVPVTEVPPDLAALLADAHLRVRCRPAGVHLGDGTVQVPDAHPRAGGRPGEEVVAAVTTAASVVVLAGPGVVLERRAADLRRFAAAAGLGVVNTWGAKGVFDWRSPHHLVTGGLQAWDFDHAGLGEVDLIVASGIDEREARGRWRLAPVVEVAPGALGAVAAAVRRPPAEIHPPRLRRDLAAVTQAGWDVTSGPLPPTGITRAYGELVERGGLVAADAGTAGYWVARTVPTTSLASVLVPAEVRPGFAVAACLVARLAAPDRPVVAVVDRLDERTERVLELARGLGVDVPLEVWEPDGPAIGAAEHRVRLAELVAGGGIARLRTDGAQLERMLEVAGPIVAWTT